LRFTRYAVGSPESNAGAPGGGGVTSKAKFAPSPIRFKLSDYRDHSNECEMIFDHCAISAQRMASLPFKNDDTAESSFRLSALAERLISNNSFLSPDTP
jgi:hypothetical protein